MSAKVCVVTGAGPALGAAYSARFAAAGYKVAMLARSEPQLRELAAGIDGAEPYPTDVTDADAVAATFAAIRSELGPVDVLIHNAGNAVFGSFTEVDVKAFEQGWRVNTLALFLCAREAMADMGPNGSGSIVVTGATASIRGGAPFAAFASAKAAQRSLAQSMARSLGPQGIHVAYIIVDGVVDTPTTREFFSDKADDFYLDPSDIADTVYDVTQQKRSAWTFELDVRPFAEKW